MADRVNYLAGPEMRATPQKNALAGRVSNAIRAVDEFARKPFGYDNPPAAMLSDALSVPAIYRTLDRIAYGEPLTTGAGQATKLRPDTVETAFTIGPSIIKWPKQVGGAIAAIAGGGVGTDDAVRAATVWHGTPHKFDKFDSSKIGTGEGAQAYGHGLYLAESKAVADEYAGKLSKPLVEFARLPEDESERAVIAAVQNAVERMQYGSRDAAAKKVWGEISNPMRDRLYGNAYAGLKPLPADKLKEALDMQEAAKRLGPPAIYDTGSLYKVDLPDEAIARMLDWDKPLSQQAPEVQAAVESVMRKRAAEAEAQRLAMNAQSPGRTTHPILSKIANKPRTAFDYKGDAAVSLLVQELGGPAKAAEYLRSKGIPGIRYLDGGSRGAGGGTSNFVVFPGEENALTILERNGQPVNALSRK